MFDAIKMMKINVNDEDYNLKYGCEEDDEDVQDKRVETFNYNFEGCKHSCKSKRQFSLDFRSYFKNEFTCKQCNVTIAHNGLKRHLISHENKR